jgi:hypothetical protein
MYFTCSGSSCVSDSFACLRASRSSVRRLTDDTRTTLPSCVFSSRFVRSTRSNAWSHGTSERCSVTFPCTSSVAMMLRPLTSARTRSTFWMSASLKSREIFCPLYAGEPGAGMIDPGTRAGARRGVVRIDGGDCARSSDPARRCPRTSRGRGTHGAAARPSRAALGRLDGGGGGSRRRRRLGLDRRRSRLARAGDHGGREHGLCDRLGRLARRASPSRLRRSWSRGRQRLEIGDQRRAFLAYAGHDPAALQVEHDASCPS